LRVSSATRNLKGQGLDEGASTRLLVHAGHLIAAGVPEREACVAAVARALGDDAEMAAAIDDLVRAVF
jgi:nitric oxide reductase NorQ protein